MNTVFLSKGQRKVGGSGTGTQDFYLKIRGELGDSGTGIQKLPFTCGALAFNVPIDSDLK